MNMLIITMVHHDLYLQCNHTQFIGKGSVKGYGTSKQQADK